MTQLNFNARSVVPAQALDPLPSAWYPCVIHATEVKPTTKGDGSYLEVQSKVQSGPHAGRIIFDNLNLVNSNQQTVDIAYKQLSAICHAVGVMDVSDSSQLHNRPLEVKVGLQAATDEFAARNKVTGYRALGAAAPGGAAAPASAAPWVAGASAPAGGAPAVPGAAPSTPAAPAAAAPAYVFPPAGWIAHPTSPGWFYQGDVVKSEAELKTMFPEPVAAPAAPAAPSAPTAPAAPAAPAPVVVFPPAGWLPHPTSPGWFYMDKEVKSEAELRAMSGAPAPAADGGKPPWAR